ncbi:nonstructural protein [Capybara microvirus Cap1_SP_223]|nr:nonstructural protein [Capybara microvirus Cap1_SP_223]
MIRDRKANTYIGDPFASVNDDTARRTFTSICNHPQNTWLAPDYELFCVGSLSCESGEISPCHEYITAGCEVLKNE